MSGPENGAEAGLAKVLSSDLPFFSPRQVRELRRKERRDAFLVALRIVEACGKDEASGKIQTLISQLEFTQ